MLRIEILHDVVGTSRYRCGVLRSFPVERIEPRNRRVPFLFSSSRYQVRSTSLSEILEVVGLDPQTEVSWNEHPFYTNRMVSDRRAYPLPLDTLSTFCPITAIHSLINTAYSLQLNTAYRSSETEAEFSCLISCLVFLSLFRTNPADIFTFVTGITSIMVNGKNAYELKGKFLDDLHKNAFSGTNREDAVEHIKYFLKIVDPIDLPNVNQDKLKRSCFPNLIGWRCMEMVLWN
ncbi:hypothetical protein Tco_0914560 [Tanacetum coccineum]